MTKPALKKSTQKDEFICLTCSMPECIPTSYRCPINTRLGPMDVSDFNLALEMFSERDRLKRQRIDLKAEIKRVRAMKSETTSTENKYKADAEIARLNLLVAETSQEIRALRSKKIAEKLEAPLHVVENIRKRSFP